MEFRPYLARSLVVLVPLLKQTKTDSVVVSVHERTAVALCFMNSTISETRDVEHVFRT